MKLLDLIETEDAITVNLDLSKEEAQALMERGFVQLLQEAIEEDKKRRRSPALFQPMGNYGGDN